MTSQRCQIHSSFKNWPKQFFDWLISFFSILILSPLFLISWPILYFFNGRPIIFKQKRLGKNAQSFTIYKLRSMVNNAETLRNRQQKKYESLNYAPKPMFKIADDPRFTKIGRWLSHAGLDELPQLINVLKGEMTLVGPRPLPNKEVLTLKKLKPDWFAWRQSVKPGIFSLWTLDDRRHQSLKIWQELEKETLKLNLWQQYYLIGQVLLKQLKK